MKLQQLIKKKVQYLKNEDQNNRIVKANGRVEDKVVHKATAKNEKMNKTTNRMNRTNRTNKMNSMGNMEMMLDRSGDRNKREMMEDRVCRQLELYKEKVNKKKEMNQTNGQKKFRRLIMDDKVSLPKMEGQSLYKQTMGQSMEKEREMMKRQSLDRQMVKRQSLNRQSMYETNQSLQYEGRNSWMHYNTSYSQLYRRQYEKYNLETLVTKK